MSEDDNYGGWIRKFCEESLGATAMCPVEDSASTRLKLGSIVYKDISEALRPFYSELSKLRDVFVSQSKQIDSMTEIIHSLIEKMPANLQQHVNGDSRLTLFLGKLLQV